MKENVNSAFISKLNITIAVGLQKEKLWLIVEKRKKWWVRNDIQKMKL